MTAPRAQPRAVVARYLLPGEQLLREWRRHWIEPVRDTFLTALIAVAAAWPASVWVDRRYLGWVISGIALVGVCYLGYRIPAGRRGWVLATDQRLLWTGGVLTRWVATVPLARAVELRCGQGPLGRLLGYGSLRLTGRPGRLSDIPGPYEVYRYLVARAYGPPAVSFEPGEFDGLYAPAPRLSTVATPVPDPAAIRQEILYQIDALTGRLAGLTQALEKLVPGPRKLK